MSLRLHPGLPRTRVEVRLAGSGGQGLILAGLVLAEAAGVYDGREVAMVQSYGPEARGGTSKAEVIISDEPIDYPLCTHVDILVAMTQEASDAYCWDLKPGAWIIVDAKLVVHPPSSRAIALPLTALARDKLHKEMMANVIALGAVSQLTGIVSRRALEKSLASRLRSTDSELIKKALSLGAKIVKPHQGEQTGEEAEDAGVEEV